VTSVLIYETELVMHGDALSRPVNYSLHRDVPPAGVQVDRRKRAGPFPAKQVSGISEPNRSNTSKATRPILSCAAQLTGGSSGAISP